MASERGYHLLDTGTDAYLRQDERSLYCMIPLNTIINTTGPEQLSASKSGLLSMYLKDNKGSFHQMLAENALVIQSLSQNLHSIRGARTFSVFS